MISCFPGHCKRGPLGFYDYYIYLARTILCTHMDEVTTELIYIKARINLLYLHYGCIHVYI